MTDEFQTNDIQLTAGDIGQIENAGQVGGFFAKLGYDVNGAVNLDHAALGMDSADLGQQIKRVRRIGEDPADGDIVIYLFETRSVTVALTQTIARRFRERPESALLVLTKDYEALDFVLVERDVVSSRSPTGALRQILRPRTLTVSRRNPTPVE